MISEKQTEIEKGYQAKVIALEESLGRFENHSIVEIWSKLDLTDDEIIYLSALEVFEEEQNMEWEEFGRYCVEERESLIMKRFKQNKALIERAK